VQVDSFLLIDDPGGRRMLISEFREGENNNG
jgi:hypothetical protein